MRTLLKTVDTFRVEKEEDAMRLIEEYKDNQIKEGYLLTKSGYVLKTRKSKGEIIESWFICTVERTFEN